MRWRATGALAMAVLAGGCGSAGTFANKPRPATAVNLTVYVNDHRVSVSPSSVGAGPVLFIVTNQATRNEAVQVLSGTGRSLATTGPINPGGTAQVEVDFRSGSYRLATRRPAGGGSAIQPATLRVGHRRPSAANALLQP